MGLVVVLPSLRLLCVSLLLHVVVVLGQDAPLGVQASKEFDGVTLATKLYKGKWFENLVDCARKKGKWDVLPSQAVSVEADPACEAEFESWMVRELASVLGVKQSLIDDEALWKEMSDVSEGGYRALNQEMLDAFAPMFEKMTDKDEPRLISIIAKKVRLYMSMLEKPLAPLIKEPEAEEEQEDAVAFEKEEEKEAVAPDTVAPAVESMKENKAVQSRSVSPVTPPAPIQPSKADEPCPDAVKALEDPTTGVDIPGAGDRGKVTPDLEDGPWYKNKQPHPFEARVTRPNIVRAIQLLKNVAFNVAQVTKLTEAARAESIPVEESLLSRGAAEVAVLETEIESATSSEESFKQIKPTQTSMHDAVFDELSPELNRISHLYQMDAEIRYPFAERSATFTMDLTKATRTRDEVCNRLVDYMPPDQLENTCAEFDAVVQNLRGKIEQEVQTATKVLNRNSAGLVKSTDKIDSVQDLLSNLRQDLASFVEDGKNHVPGLKTVKQQALADEKVMIRGVTAVKDAQTHLLEQSKSIGESQLEQLEHVSALLEALGVDATEPPESASLPPSAHRTIKYEGEPSDAPIYARVNSPEVPMPPPPMDPEEA